MRDLRALPKVELHLHLEGSMRPETARELSVLHGAPLPHGLTPDGWRFDGSLDFIDNYVEACDLLRSLEDFRRLGEEVCEDLAATGVRYAEAVFSPSNHAARLDDWTGPLEAVLDGLDAGRRRTGVEVRLTPDIVRDLGTLEAERVTDIAIAYADRGVVALNCAGSERTVVEEFAPMFRRAKDAGLRSTPHAGEWGGPENVWATLEHYLPDRIGHGIRAIDDPRLVEHLAERAIPLDVSPLSNVATGAWPSIETHPLPALRAAGVVVTLNSDDPGMFGGGLAHVFETARVAWGMDDGALAELARAGVRASFTDEATKHGLLAGIDAWLEDQPSEIVTESM
jgi:adenosine deaminase